MGEPKVKFEIDEHGRIVCRVTNEGVLLSKEEKELIISNILCLQEQNAKLREQMERLVTLLRADCDIEASWDGLRKFWSIGLTEDGCLMRDRACKAEAENDKLRELLQRALTSHNKMCSSRGTCLGCLLFSAKPSAPVCPIAGVTQDAHELGIETGDE